MNREIIRPLPAWNSAAGAILELERGAVVHSCHIRKHKTCGSDQTLESYAMEFQFGQKVYICPLVLFQARTQVMDAVSLTRVPAVATAAA